MKKPTIRKEVAIVCTFESIGNITLYASRDAALEFAGFGNVIKQEPNRYELWVDRRFDFWEVVGFIKAYGEDQ